MMIMVLSACWDKFGPSFIVPGEHTDIDFILEF